MKRTITTIFRVGLCALAMLFALPSYAQTGTIPIGSGTAATAQSLPAYTYYYYTYSQQIVKASDFAAGEGGAGPISKIRYYLSTAQTPLANWNNWTVYMGHTTKAAFASTTDWEPLTNLQQVFTGTVTQVAGQWMEITFSTPFIYDGTSNIIVAVDENSPGYTDSLTSTYYGSYAGPTNTGIYYASDTVNPDPASPPAGTRTATLPRLQFEGTLAACKIPTAVETLAASTTSATIGWTPPAIVPGMGYEYLISTTNTAPDNTAAGTGVSSNSVTLPVNDATMYYFWVRSKCSDSDKSSWVAYNFTTPCVATDVPYIEDFESVTVPALPGCTLAVNYGAGNTWVTASPATGAFQTKVLRYNFTYNGSANTWFYTRGINLTAGTSYRISYLYGTSSATYHEKMKVAYGTDRTPAAMTNVLADYADLTGINSATAEIDFTPATSGVYYFGFQAYSASGQNYIYVDNVKVNVSPTCLKPTNLEAVATGPGSINISWNAPTPAPASGYEYYVSTDALDAPVANTQGTDVPTGTSATYAAMENTAYFIWVRSKCAGNDRSEWAGPVAATTPCTPTDIPYFEDFETVTPPALPDCTKVVKTGAGNLWATNATTLGGFSSNTLRYAVSFSAAANTWFFTQGINLTAGTSYRITYKYGASSTFYTEKLKVAYGTANTAAAMTNELANYTSVTGTTYNTASIDFTPQASGVYYFGFQAYSAISQNSLYVDDILIDLSPSCLAPVNVQAQATSPSSIAISWGAATPVPANGYEYYVGTDVTDVPTANTDGTDVPTGTSATYAAVANTKYYIYVRSSCTGESSEWTQMISVTTPCESTNVPYVQDFESVTTPALPDCTLVQNAGTGNNWTTNSPAAYGFTSKALRYNYSLTNAANAWFFTQGINLTAGVTYRISYKYGNSGNTTYIEKLKVAYGTTASASAMNTQLADHNNINSNVAVSTYVDFTPQSSGVYYFGFHAYSDANKDKLYVDDITVDTTAGTGNGYDLAQFVYYPNPVKDVLNLSYISNITSVELFNMLGQKVLGYEVNAAETAVDMSQLPDGNYILNVSVADAVKTIKVVKKQ